MPRKALNTPGKRRDGRSAKNGTQSDGAPSRGALVADIIIANAPDPVFVSDLEGKILQANDAVSQLLGFRQDEVIEQSLSRFISAGGDARVHRRAARGGRARRHPQRSSSTPAAPRAR